MSKVNSNFLYYKTFLRQNHLRDWRTSEKQNHFKFKQWKTHPPRQIMSSFCICEFLMFPYYLKPHERKLSKELMVISRKKVCVHITYKLHLFRVKRKHEKLSRRRAITFSVIQSTSPPGTVLSSHGKQQKKNQIGTIHITHASGEKPFA